MALLVGLLIGLGRISADREAVALLACGVSPYRLLRPVLVLAAVATAATLYVMIEALPDSNQRYRQIVLEILHKKVETEIRPGVFFEEFPNWVLFPRTEAEPGEVGWRDLMVADYSQPESIKVYMARHGRVAVDSANRTLRLVLTDGTAYASGAPGDASTNRFRDQFVITLDPQSVFGSLDPPRGVTEKTIAQLQKDIKDKRARGTGPENSPHNEIMAIHQKFSIPAACIVFAVIALALGVSVAKGGKLGGFVVGIGVIFAYYIAMFLAESAAKGFRIPAEWARWIPNILLGPFGIAALIMRARHAEGRLPFGLKLPAVLTRWTRRTEPPSTTDQPSLARHKPRPVVVIRLPRLHVPKPGLLDRYISRLYLRVAGLSFLGLLGLFYISTFIDRSDKIFKGKATPAMVGELLIWLTPQFIYYVIPIAALLSVLVTYGILARTSELTVMKACGVSLYRSALSVVFLSLMFSGVLFVLEQHVMAQANRRAEVIDARIKDRQPKTLNVLQRRWVTKGDSIYHNRLFDSERLEMFNLTLFRIKPNTWELASQTFVRSATFRNGTWVGTEGSRLDFAVTRPISTPISKQPLPEMEPPQYFATEPPEPQFMDVRDLLRYIGELKTSGFNVVPATVELQRKLAFPLVTVVMALIAIPFGVGAGRHGALYGIGLGIVIALSYWILISAFVAIGRASLLPPVLAGWTPNVLVTGIALYLMLRART
jgi:LPS export ABC transporter permease LptG